MLEVSTSSKEIVGSQKLAPFFLLFLPFVLLLFFLLSLSVSFFHFSVFPSDTDTETSKISAPSPAEINFSLIGDRLLFSLFSKSLYSNAWKWKVKVKSLSHVRLLATSWTAAYQAPPSMGFSRQEYWSGVPLTSPRMIQRSFKLGDLCFNPGLFPA